MPRPLVRSLVLLVIPALLGASCGDDETATSSSGSASPAEEQDAWTFTDDRGVQVSLPERPERIVAYHNAAAALIPLDVVPVGVFGGSTPQESPLLEGLDLTGVESVGNVYGELNFEQLAALQPDLIVTLFDPIQKGPAFGFVGDAQDKAADIAPIVALDGAADPAAAIERFEELAAALGTDLEDPAIAADREAFEAAVDGLEAAIAENPELTAVAFQVYAGDGIYFARPDAFPSLRLFREGGLDIVEPEGDPGDVNEDFVNFFWDLASLELGGKYPADLVLLGNNAGAMDAQEILGVPTLAERPEVEAGQVVTWQVLDRYSYDAFTAELEDLTGAVEAADPLVVP